jgi:hypothetical protein
MKIVFARGYIQGILMGSMITTLLFSKNEDREKRVKKER